MPIYSDSDEDRNDRLSSMFSAVAASSSLAASAAAQLAADPHAQLPPRLRSAVQAVIALIDGALQLKDYSRDSGPNIPELVAAMVAEPSDAETQNRSISLAKLHADLQTLLEEPDTKVAARLERYLDELSRREGAMAQSLDRSNRDGDVLNLVALS